MAVAADLVLIGCAKSTSAQPARAAELFTGALFTGRRAFAQASGLPWYILSAQYGVLAPGDVIGPYDLCLADQPRAYRQAWGEFVCAQLAVLYGDPSGRTIEVHADAAYTDPLRLPLEKRGARLATPTGHLGLGQQQAWYRNLSAPTTDDPAAVDRSVREVAALTAALTDPARARTPAEFLAAGQDGFNRPGLYSWWVDGAGAGDLADGLGMTFAPGLIYAGQAGATRWPSGQRSTNTLWGRIARMHLSGRAEFSTFRRTLAAALRDVPGLDGENAPQLDAWIGRHLRVIAVAVDDADELGRLEDAVLAALDPPLNLRGRPTTALRARLRERRGSRPSRNGDDGEASLGAGSAGDVEEGIVGESYASAVEAVRGHCPEDPDQHAAEERLACHRHFGAALPSDGGRPALTRQVAARRDRQSRAQPPAPKLCSTCRMELPLNGRCDNCQ